MTNSSPEEGPASFRPECVVSGGGPVSVSEHVTEPLESTTSILNIYSTRPRGQSYNMSLCLVNGFEI